MEPLLDVRGLKKYFPIAKGLLHRVTGHVRAVDDVSFTVNAGETLGLVGESGCGKTTLSRCILRAIDPTGGQILYRTRNGNVVDLAPMRARDLVPLRQEIQMVFQDPFGSLNPRMTLLDNVGEPLLMHGMRDRGQRADRVAELLRLVGLRPEFMHRFPHAFSGGQRQRIGIARALATNPRLVVADEPVSALDVSIRAQILELLRQCKQELKLTMLFLSHDLGVVRHIADRVAVMYLGKIVEIAPVATLFGQARHPYTRMLLGAALSVHPGGAAGQPGIEAIGDPPSPIDPPSGCRFRTRCPFAFERCATEEPLLNEVAPSHRSACHLGADDRHDAAPQPGRGGQTAHGMLF
jgi:peptide/nickel transport system ATP-binding protein